MRPVVLKAVCELRFALSTQALKAALRALTEDFPVQRQLPDALAFELLSQDRAWMSRISSQYADVTAPEGSLIEDFSEKLRRFAEALLGALGGTVIRSVEIHFWEGLPLIGKDRIEDLFNHALRTGPWELQGEFAQTLTGTTRECDYALRFGVRHFEHERRCYLAQAKVVALNVRSDLLAAVIERLGEEGTRLLAWPLAERDYTQLSPRDPSTADFRRATRAHRFFFTGQNPGQINEERVSLLSRKHLGEAWTAEDEARLQAVSAHVRALWPKVTDADWFAFDSIEHRIDERAERLRKIERELDLKLAS